MAHNVIDGNLDQSLFELPPDHIVVALRSRTGFEHLGWRKPGHAERLKAAVLLASDTLLRDDLSLAERAVLSPPRRSESTVRILDFVTQLDRDPRWLTGHQVLADLRAAEEILAWLTATQVGLIARLAEPGCAGDATALAYANAQLDPEALDPTHEGPSTEHWRLAGIQQATGHLGAALTISTVSAGYRITDAQDLTEDLPHLHQALAEGRIDPIRARILQQRTRVLGPRERYEAVRRLLPLAKHHNPGRFSTLVDAAVLEADPDAAEARRQEALDRRDLRFAPSEDGMARFIATLPATEAQLAWDLFDSIAQALKGVDDQCAAHRRTDAFTTLIELLAAGHAVSAQSLLDQVLTTDCTCTRPGTDVDGATETFADHLPNGGARQTDVTVGNSTAMPDGTLGETAGKGSRPADEAQLTDTTAGETMPPAGRTDDESAGADGSQRQSATPDATAEFDTAGRAECLDSCARKPIKQWTLPTRQGRRTHTTITVPWDIFTFFGSNVAELAGYGIITAAWARTLMEAASTVTLLVTDPSTGQAVAVGERTYRPQQDVRDKVVTALPSCIFTGCSCRAEKCDCEHCKAFHRKHPELGGSTNLENLFPVCRLHHRLKTFGGWSYNRGQDGIEVRSPLGLTTTTRPVLGNLVPDSSPPPF